MGEKVTEEYLTKPVELKKQITLFQAISICVGYMIGSGIFVSPYGVVMNVKSVGMALAVWVFCGLFNMVRTTSEEAHVSKK